MHTITQRCAGSDHITSLKAILDRIKTIQYMAPRRVTTADRIRLQKKVDATLAAFHYRGKAALELRTLRNKEEWDAARDAALDAAWNAALDAARNAAWEVVADLMPAKGWTENPYSHLLDLWAEGFYVVGVVNRRFILYYTPKEDDEE